MCYNILWTRVYVCERKLLLRICIMHTNELHFDISVPNLLRRLHNDYYCCYRFHCRLLPPSSCHQTHSLSLYFLSSWEWMYLLHYWKIFREGKHEFKFTATLSHFNIILQAGKTILYLWLQQQKVTNNNYVCVCPFEMLARIIPIVLPQQSHMSSTYYFLVVAFLWLRHKMCFLLLHAAAVQKNI